MGEERIGDGETIPGSNWPGRTKAYVTERHARAAYRRQQRARIMRPQYWNPENIAAKIADGMTILDIARQGSLDCGKRTSSSVLARDIYAWEKDPEWAPLFATARDTKVDPADRSWWPDFFKAMDDTEGNIRESCRIAGVAPRLVWTMADPRFAKRYDEEFALRFEEAKAASQASIASHMTESLNKPGADPKAQLNYLKATSPAQYSERSHVDVSIRGRIEHVAQQRSIAASAQRRIASLRPAEDVIDAEVIPS